MASKIDLSVILRTAYLSRSARRDGTTADVEVTASLLTYGNQKDFQIVLHDITEHK